MALAANETWARGFVVNTTTGNLVTTYTTVGAFYQDGFVRDPDGRLVVVPG